MCLAAHRSRRVAQWCNDGERTPPWRFIYAKVAVLSSSLVHADHSAWAESVVELVLLFAALSHLCETRPLSQTRDRSRLSLRRQLPSLWWKRLWSPRRDTMPIVPDAARNQGVLQIARAFLHLEDTTTLRCLSVTALSFIDRY